MKGFRTVKMIRGPMDGFEMLVPVNVPASPTAYFAKRRSGTMGVNECKGAVWFKKCLFPLTEAEYCLEHCSDSEAFYLWDERNVDDEVEA